MHQIGAIGHRIVNGGEWLTEPVLVSEQVLADLEKCRDIAPLHTVPHLLGIRGCMEVPADHPAGAGHRHRLPPHDAREGVLLPDSLRAVQKV